MRPVRSLSLSANIASAWEEEAIEKMVGRRERQAVLVIELVDEVDGLSEDDVGALRRWNRGTGDMTGS